jgi:hypothetical protein
MVAVLGLLGACGKQNLEGGLVVPATPTLCAITAELKEVNPGVVPRNITNPLPATHQLSLLIDWQGKTATTGANGSTADKVALSLDDSTGEWSTQGEVDLVPVLYPHESNGLMWPTMSYRQIVIHPTADGCAGRATGNYRANESNDTMVDVPFTATLVGVVDHTGPGLALFPVDVAEMHPLDLQGVGANELLPAGTSARLVAPDGTMVPFVSLPVGSAVGVSGFQLDKNALNFATTYRIEVLPSAVDLAGNATAVLPSVTTRQGPGLFAQDGFEGPVEALLGGMVKVVDATAQVVPTGNRAIRFAPINSSERQDWSCDDRFTARLLVPPGAKAVKLNVLPVKANSVALAPPFGAGLRLATPNGAIWLSKDWWSPPTDGTKVEFPLPEEAGNEVIFDLYRRCYGGGDGLILDDLRVE